MSWFSSWFSSPKSTSTSTPSPSSPSRSSPEPTRLLEEPAPSSPQPSRTDLEAQFLSEKSRRPPPSIATQNDNPNRNKIIFGAGVVFFGFSVLITRRAFIRKRIAGTPAFYSDGPQHHVEQSAKVSGAKEALEALNLATLNVLSFAMMATGGSLWYLNINNIQDARRMLRGGLGVDGTGRTEEDAEEEFEEWLATVLARKEAKHSTTAAVAAASRTGMMTNERGQQR